MKREIKSNISQRSMPGIHPKQIFGDGPFPIGIGTVIISRSQNSPFFIALWVLVDLCMLELLALKENALQFKHISVDCYPSAILSNISQSEAFMIRMHNHS